MKKTNLKLLRGVTRGAPNKNKRPKKKGNSRGKEDEWEGVGPQKREPQAG